MPKHTLSEKAASFKRYFLSITFAFFQVFFLALPTIQLFKGYQLNEVIVIPMGAVFFGPPALLIACLSYPIFRMVFNGIDGPYPVKVATSGGVTIGLFYAVNFAVYTFILDAEWVHATLSIVLLSTGITACFNYWLLTK